MGPRWHDSNDKDRLRALSSEQASVIVTDFHTGKFGCAVNMERARCYDDIARDTKMRMAVEML